jgi:hypothetical protein
MNLYDLLNSNCNNQYDLLNSNCNNQYDLLNSNCNNQYDLLNSNCNNQYDLLNEQYNNEFSDIKKYLSKISINDAFKIRGKIRGGSPLDLVSDVVNSTCNVLERQFVNSALPVPTTECPQITTDVSKKISLADLGKALFSKKKTGKLKRKLKLTREKRKSSSQILDKQIVIPENMNGYLVNTHGLSLEKSTTFMVPENTFIIFLTELGKLGISDNDENLFEMFGDKDIYEHLLYLLTYDYSNEILGTNTYFGSRKIYTPYSLCIDSILNLSSSGMLVDCRTVYNKIKETQIGTLINFENKVNSKKYEFYEPKPVSQILNIYERDSYFGLFNMPIKFNLSYNITHGNILYPTPIESFFKIYLGNVRQALFDYCSKFLKDEKDELDFRKILSTYTKDSIEQFCVDINDTILLLPLDTLLELLDFFKRNSYENLHKYFSKFNRVFNVNDFKKQEQKGTEYEFACKLDVKNGLDYSLLDLSNPEKLKAHSKQLERKGFIQDFALFSDIVINLKREFDKNNEMKKKELDDELLAKTITEKEYLDEINMIKNNKLVILTTQCRAFTDLSGETIMTCLKLEDSIMKYLAKVEKLPAEKRLLKYAKDNIISKYGEDKFNELTSNLSQAINDEFKGTIPVIKPKAKLKKRRVAKNSNSSPKRPKVI